MLTVKVVKMFSPFACVFSICIMRCFELLASVTRSVGVLLFAAFLLHLLPPLFIHPVLHSSPPPASTALLSFPRSPATVNLNLPAFDFLSFLLLYGHEVTQHALRQPCWRLIVHGKLVKVYDLCWIEIIHLCLVISATDWAVLFLDDVTLTVN